MLIGICGKAGSGKDTIGEHLIEEYGFEQIALADPIKRLVKDVFVLDDHTVYDRSAREQELPEWKDWSVRKLLQFIGTELFRENIDPSIWVKSLWLRVKHNPDKNYVVTDVRFPNELQFFVDHGGDDFLSIKSIRAGCDGSVGLSGHESEKYDLEAEHDMYNDGTIEELYSKVDELMNGLDISKVGIEDGMHFVPVSVLGIGETMGVGSVQTHQHEE
jgi:hypothetical protein